MRFIQRAMEVRVWSGRYSKFAVIVANKLGQIQIGLFIIADTQETHFLDQTILQSLVGSLHPSLGLWWIGANQFGIQDAERPLELSNRFIPELFSAIDPKDAKAVTVESLGQAMFPKVALTQVPIAKEAFFGHKFSCQDLAGGIIHKHQQSGFGPTIFQPGMFRTVYLHQFSTMLPSGTSVMGLSLLFDLCFPDTSFNHHLSQRLFAQTDTFHLLNLFSHQSWSKTL